MSARRLVLVVGVGRSGTSVLAGILGHVGFQIPQPEVRADSTNPRGFGEPRWVVELHERLMRERRVTVNDARPAAWAGTRAVADVAAVRAELRGWLASQFRTADAVVVKDPRTVWFLDLWRRCADELGIPIGFATMLRHPAESLTSAVAAYGIEQTEASRAAAWLNVILETERATRDAPRAFLRYEALLRDWAAETARAGAELDLPLLADLDRARFPAVDAFVDPTLHRVRVRWEGLDVPASVRALADDVWERLQPLTRPDGDTATLRAGLDDARAAYVRLYGAAEAIAQPSITAAVAAAGGGAARPPMARRLAVGVVRRLPTPYRRRLRRVVRSLRASRGPQPG
jgi:hypothetical protein